MSDGFKTKMVGAFAWSSLDRLGQQVVQLIFGIVLARLLLPSEVGLIAVLMIFVSLSSVLIDGGFGQALIRKQKVTQTDYNTVFVVNLGISLVLYLILFFAAPAIATFFKQPALTNISRILFTSTIFFGLYFIHYTQLIKQLNYRSYAIINISSFLFSGSVAIILALLGYGVWALVAQQIGFHLIRLFIFPFFVKWAPTFKFSFEIIKEVWSFSFKLLGTNILNVIFNQLYTVLLGRFFSLHEVGFYFQANKLSETVNGTTQQVIQNATFPLFSKIQDEDARLLRIYRQLTKSISLIVFPLSGFVMAASYPLIITLLSEKWRPTVELFQLLILANLFTPLYLLNISILNSRGESNRTFRMEVFKKALILISIVSCFSLGIYVMLVGFVAASFIAYIFSFIQIKKSLKHALKFQVLDILPFLIFGIGLGFSVNLLNIIEINYLLKLLAQSLSAAVLFIGITRLVFRDEFDKIFVLIFTKQK